MNLTQMTIISTTVDKNPFEEIEENNRMGKTRDLFKKIRDTKGTFHAKMDTIKDRNGMDLTEAEDIKKRWQGLECKTRKSRNTWSNRQIWPWNME